jgi:hypothetical protein
MINGKFIPNVIGELRREVDPNGQIVEHRVRNSAYVHDRMHSAGKLAAELYAAAEKFRLDFERAQLSGSYARSDLFRTRAGKGIGPRFVVYYCSAVYNARFLDMIPLLSGSPLD